MTLVFIFILLLTFDNQHNFYHIVILSQLYKVNYYNPLEFTPLSLKDQPGYTLFIYFYTDVNVSISIVTKSVNATIST